ncbi:MAG TPA: hypothetical protein VF898_00040, partial [Chloroflexota bacterium]
MKQLPKVSQWVFSILCALSLSLQGMQPAAAQAGGTERIEHHLQTGKVSFIGAAPGQTLRVPGALAPGLAPQDRALAMIQPYGADFGLRQADRELRLEGSEHTNGRQITRFQQTYQDVPVMAGELVVDATDQGGLISINGEIAPDLNLSTTPSISAEQAQQTALQAIARWYKGQPADYQVSGAALWIYDSRLLKPDGLPAALVWRMDVTSKDPRVPLKELELVDAQRGNIRLHFNQLDTELAPKVTAAGNLPAAIASWPVYFELALDEARGWIYGSDSSGNKVDVISMSTLQLVKSFTLVNGATPKGIALSPDGSELAIAQNGASSILFLNPTTGATVGTVIPNVTTGPNRPWDLMYGRTGRMYSTGNGGIDFIHVINTTTHTEISRSSTSIGSYPRLAISADNNTLYTSEAQLSPQNLDKFDVSTDTIPAPFYIFGAGFYENSFILDRVENLIFTDSGQVWTADAKSQIGSTGLSGQVAYIPTHHAVAIATNTAVTFASAQNFYPLSRY